MKLRDIVVLLLCLLLISNAATYFLTRFFFSAEPETEVVVDEDKQTLFWEIWELLEEDYYEPLEEEEMMRGAIEGMLRSLDDPHTSYMTSEAMDEMRIQTRGAFGGIGVEITKDEGEVLILNVIEDSPAHEAGLNMGDRIVEVDGESIEGKALNDVAQILRGQEGTNVEVTVLSPEEGTTLEVEITRSEIEMVTVSDRMLQEDIGYIEVSNFDGNTAEDFSAALSSLEESDLNGLIIDLRNNPGGLLEGAVDLGKLIVPSGEITRMVDREGNVIERHFSRAEPKDYPIAVIVNEYTASAAEIIAGALQESDSGILIGEPTFGKASVQMLQELSDGGGLRYTVANYLTPEGRDLDRYGLTPDVKVELPEEYHLQYRSVPKELEMGDTGNTVVLLQEMLKFLVNEVEITGVYDEQTSQALIEFQESHALSPSGELDSATREQLRQALSKNAEKADTQLQKALEVVKEKDF